MAKLEKPTNFASVTVRKSHSERYSPMMKGTMKPMMKARNVGPRNTGK